MVRRGTWTAKEDERLRRDYQEAYDEITAFVFWNSVYAKFKKSFPGRSRTAVQARGELIGLPAKKTPSDAMVCVGLVPCDRVGVHNRKRSLCLDCWQKLQRKGI